MECYTESRDRYNRGGGAGGAGRDGGHGDPPHPHRHGQRGDQYVASAPSHEQFQLHTQNRYDGLKDNEMN